MRVSLEGDKVVVVRSWRFTRERTTNILNDTKAAARQIGIFSGFDRAAFPLNRAVNVREAEVFLARVEKFLPTRVRECRA